MDLKRAFKVLIASVVAAFSCVSFAKVVFLSDVDGTWNNDERPDAAWITPVILKRKNSRLESGFQQPANKPMEVMLSEKEHIEYYNRIHNIVTDDVTTPRRVTLWMPNLIRVTNVDFMELQKSIAKSDSDGGDLHPFMLQFDPLYPERELLIVPGAYKEFDDTYKYFRGTTARRGKNYPLDHLKQAIEREKLWAARGETKTWKGPAYELAKAFYSSPDTVQNFYRFTLRGGEARDYYAMDDYLVEIGEYGYSKSSDGKRGAIYFGNNPESIFYGHTNREVKVNVPLSVLRAMRRTSGDRHWERQADGSFKLTHTLIVGENDPVNFDQIYRLMARESGGYYEGVKLVTLNTGMDHIVEKARAPRAYTVIEPNRQSRPATPQEIWDWHHFKESQAIAAAWVAANPNHPNVVHADCIDALIFPEARP